MKIFDTTFYDEHSKLLQEANRANEKALLEVQCLTRVGRMRHAIIAVMVSTQSVAVAISSFGATVKEAEQAMRVMAKVMPKITEPEWDKMSWRFKMDRWNENTSDTRKAFVRLNWAWYRFLITAKQGWIGRLLITLCKNATLILKRL